VPEEALLPFDVLYENERATAYRITSPNYINYRFSNRGPIVVELITGNGIVYHNETTQQTKEVKAGMYLYIPPASNFQFTGGQTEPVHMVLFELK
jgi:hypothetical protein